MLRIAPLVLILLPQVSIAASRTILSEELGDQWPLTVEEGTISCVRQNGDVAIFIAPGGDRYALNGTALSRRYALIDPIWKNDAEVPELKMRITPLLHAALQLCAD